MRRGPAFSDVLQDKLDACPVEADAAAPASRGSAGAPPLGFFFFSDSGLSPSANPYSNPRRWKPVPRPRPRRTLLPHQQRALDELVGLGANLPRDFTGAELRSAFRALAREYHPDRHPGSGEFERDRLAALFARVRAAYEHLQGAMMPVV